MASVGGVVQELSNDHKPTRPGMFTSNLTKDTFNNCPFRRGEKNLCCWGVGGVESSQW